MSATMPAIDSLWDYEDPEGTEQRFRGLLSRARSSGDDAYTGELLTQLARAVCLQRKYEEAHGILDEASELLSEDFKRGRLRCHLERGRVLNDTGRTREALHHCQEACKLGQHLGELRLTVDALHMIATISEGEEGVRWHRIAIEYCEKHPEDERARRWLPTLYINVADKHEELGQYALGIDAVKKGIALARRMGSTERVLGAKCFLARLHRLGGEFDRALRVIEEVLKTDYSRGYLFEEYAELLLATGEREQATRQFRRAYELLAADPWYPPSERERLNRLRDLAGV